MKKNSNTALLILIAPVLLVLASCAGQQKYAYVKNAPRYIPMPIDNTYGTTIFAGDRLYIEVFSQTPESTRPFNQRTTNTDNKRFMRDTLHAAATRGYLVGTDGYIVFPLIGSVKAEGMTLDSLSHTLEARLKAGNYVSDALVTAKLMNFRVAVIGEVKNPSQLHCDGNRLTILEAIAQCGDITMDAEPSCVVVVRKSPNGETVDTVDLTNRTLFDSPCYYLQQNDVVYVSPTEKRRKKAWRNEDWPRYISMGTSALSIAYMTIYRVVRTQSRFQQ